MKINLRIQRVCSNNVGHYLKSSKMALLKLEQHSGQRIYLRDAMEDVANTVEYMLESKNKKDK